MASPMGQSAVGEVAAATYLRRLPKMYFPAPAPETEAVPARVRWFELVVIIPLVKVRVVLTVASPLKTRPALFAFSILLKVKEGTVCWLVPLNLTELPVIV